MAKLFFRALQSVSVTVGSEECGRVGKRRKAGCGLGLGLLQKRMKGFYNIRSDWLQTLTSKLMSSIF
jgi:hypothetical protein